MQQLDSSTTHSPIAARRMVVAERIEDKHLHLRKITVNPFDDQKRQRLNVTLSTRQIAELERELTLLDPSKGDEEEVPVAVAAELHKVTAPDLIRLKKTGELSITEKYLSAYLEASEMRILERYGAERLIQMSREFTATVTRQAIEALRYRDFEAATLHIRRIMRRDSWRVSKIFDAALLLVISEHDGDGEACRPWYWANGGYVLGNLESAIVGQQKEVDRPVRYVYNPFRDIDLRYLRGLLNHLEFTGADALRIKSLAFMPTLEERKAHTEALRTSRKERLKPIAAAAKRLASTPSSKKHLTDLIKALVGAGYSDKLVELVEREAIGLEPLPPQDNHN